MPFAAACPNAMTALSLDFSAYLDALCDRYQRWQTLYTLTDVEGKQELQEKLKNQPGQWDLPFDFGLMVQTAVRDEGAPNRGTGTEEEKVERFSVLEGIRKYAQNHVLLLGRPGSGKSTALARLVFDEARQKRAIPVLVELRSWQGSIEALIGNALGRHGLILTEGQLRALWQDDRLLLLFDGLNELPSEEARSQLTIFRQDHPNISMIFTTRDLSIGGDFGIEKRLEMQPLTESQMQAFVRSYIPDLAEQMLRQLSDRLRELGQTPLLLRMLCDLFRTTGEIPENLGLVFRLFTQGYERNLKGDVPIGSDREWWKPVLQQLAWVMMQGVQPTELRVTIGKSEAVRAIGQFLERKVPYAEDFARKCLRDLQRHHLIQAGAGNEDLEFRHQLIQEYYAAEALLERLPGLSDAVLQREYLNYLKWTEPVALMLALVESEDEALRVVRSGLEVDLMLGARLAGEVRDSFQEEITRTVVHQKVPESILIKLLSTVKSEYSAKILTSKLNSNAPWISNMAAGALAEFGTEEAIFALIQALEKADTFHICNNAAQALGNTSSTMAVKSLIKALTDNRFGSDSLLESAAAALGHIGDIDAEQALLQTLNNQKDCSVREVIAYSLARIGSKTSISASIKALHENGTFEYGNLFYEVANLGYKFYIDFLSEASRSRDIETQRIAGEALKTIGTTQIDESSVEELYSEILWNRSKCIFRFADRGDFESIFEIFYDGPHLHEEAAIQVLMEIGTPSLLHEVHELLMNTGNPYLISVIFSIQSRCKYYNHEIYQSAPETLKLTDRTILILAANPTDRTHLRLDQEAREIEEGLRRSKHRDRFTLKQCWAVRPDDLRRALLDHSPRILHFCGHGEGKAGIVLEAENGEAKLVSTEAIANLFKLVADQGLECVILNACYSEIQAEAIAQHIPYVIGMSDSIFDATARKFAIGFYDALGAGWSYEKAYAMGKSAIETEGIPEAHLPVLKRRQGGQK
jgi:HEAT repeat protein